MKTVQLKRMRFFLLAMGTVYEWIFALGYRLWVVKFQRYMVCGKFIIDDNKLIQLSK